MEEKKRILIADDDSGVRAAFSVLLQNAGYQVGVAADGEEAEAKLAGEPVDLLILDLHLPREEGWNVFGLASAWRPLLPIIVLTETGQQNDLAFLPGVAACLEKPVDPVVVLNIVSRLFAEPSETRLRRLTDQQRTRATPQFALLTL
jgi:DNA-binding NtrC family response regulator